MNTIKVGMLPEIIAALQETEAAAQEAGLLDDKAAHGSDAGSHK